MSAGLFESESTGGAVARVGFAYQDAFVLQHIPLWLSQGAFSHVVSEAIGDVEVCYFAPGGATSRVFYEAKDTVLTSTEFWKEIARFETAHDTSPAEFMRFVLVCRGYNSVTAPLVAMLERLRGVGASFASDSVVITAGRQEITDWLVKNGKAAETARFVLDHVMFMTYASEHAANSFAGMVANHLPSLDLGSKQVSALRDQCKVLVDRSSFGPVYRRDIESALIDVMGDKAATWVATPTRLLLEQETVPVEELGLAVGDFNGPARAGKTSLEWEALASQAAGIGHFIKESRWRRCMAIDGKQRMSLACVLGHSFSATQGFVLQVEHNGHLYPTDNHSKLGGRFFDERTELGEVHGGEGVACIAFPTALGDDVNLATGGSLKALPRLTLNSSHVLNEMATLNLAVAEAKGALVRFRSVHMLNRVHLFVKAPSVFAMVLGHRLNGVGTIQLYDWVNGRYVASALILPS